MPGRGCNIRTRRRPRANWENISRLILAHIFCVCFKDQSAGQSRSNVRRESAHTSQANTRGNHEPLLWHYQSACQRTYILTIYPPAAVDAVHKQMCINAINVVYVSCVHLVSRFEWVRVVLPPPIIIARCSADRARTHMILLPNVDARTDGLARISWCRAPHTFGIAARLLSHVYAHKWMSVALWERGLHILCMCPCMPFTSLMH